MAINENVIKTIITNYKKNKTGGIISICTSNKNVIRACMKRFLNTDIPLLIEATANQVNQFGGYTGMTPLDFVNYVSNIATEINFPLERVILGGDHLGPLTWVHLPQDEAMQNAKTLLNDYLLAGFTKIHIDTSMPIYDDLSSGNFGDNLIASRAAILAKVCDDAFILLKEKNPNATSPVYVIGSEVPVPGGVKAEEAESEITNGIDITSPKNFSDTVSLFYDKFNAIHADSVLKNIVGVVVQPGVEFSSDTIWAYDREKAKELTNSLSKFDNIVFEAHSADYQTEKSLKELVQDGFAILKVGPAFTFAFREATFLLAKIEEELAKCDLTLEVSNFKIVLEATMVKHPNNWVNHYSTIPEKFKFERLFSLSDRCRYYIPEKEVDYSFNKLIENLNSKEIPLALISQYMHTQYIKVRNKQLNAIALDLLEDYIGGYIDDYIYAIK